MLHEICASGAGNSGASAIHFYVFPPAPIVKLRLRGDEAEVAAEDRQRRDPDGVRRHRAHRRRRHLAHPTRAEKKVDEAGWSTVRRCGPPTPRTPTRSCCSPARRRVTTAKPLDGHDALLRRPRPRPRSRCARSRSSGRRRSTPTSCSSTTSRSATTRSVGEVGKGFYHLLDGLNPERIVVAHGADRHRPRRPGPRGPVRQGARRVRPADRQEPGRSPIRWPTRGSSSTRPS